MSRERRPGARRHLHAVRSSVRSAAGKRVVREVTPDEAAEYICTTAARACERFWGDRVEAFLVRPHGSEASVFVGVALVAGDQTFEFRLVERPERPGGVLAEACMSAGCSCFGFDVQDTVVLVGSFH